MVSVAAAWARSDAQEHPRALRLLVALLVANVGLWAVLAVRFGIARYPNEVDGQCLYVYLPSLFIDGDLDFTNQYQRIGMPVGQKSWAPSIVPATGKPANKYPVGYALLVAGPFLLAHGLTLLVNSPALPADGYSLLYRLFVTLATLAYTWGGLALIYRIGCRYYRPTVVAAAIGLVWIGSNLAFYTTYNLSMTEGVSLAAFALLAWLTLRLIDGHDRLRDWAWAGLVAGLMTIIHYLNGVLTLFPAVVAGARLVAGPARTRTLVGGMAFLAGMLVAIFPQALATYAIYGTWFHYGYEGETFSWLHPQLVNILFSSRHGLLFWSPLLGLSLAGLIGLAVRRRDLAARGLAATTFVAIYCLSCWWCWWFGAGFGNRGFLRLGLPLVLGMCASVQYLWARSRPLLAAVVLLGAVWNFLLMAQYLSNMISHFDHVPLSRIWTNTWVMIGRLIQGI